MTDTPNEMGLCSYHRYKGGKIKSMGSMCFAVHHTTTDFCPEAKSIGGFFFDANRPPLSQPIVITAKSVQDMKIGLRNSSRKIVSNPSFTNEGPLFTLHWGISSFQEGGRSVTFHDATKIVIQNVGGTITGVMPLSGVAETINDVGGIAIEISDRSGLTNKIKGGISRLRGKVPTKLASIVVYPYAVPGAVNLGVTTITMKDLARQIWST